MEELRTSLPNPSYKWHSLSLNCLPMNAIVRLLSNTENTIPIQAHSRQSFLNCLLTITLLLINITTVQPLATLYSITPSIVPFQGGTIIYANGTGFESVNFPKCQIHTNHGVLAISDNTVINDTTMQCIIPHITQVYKNSIITSNSVELKIISGVNGSVQILFFDLDLISVYSVTPNWTYISDDYSKVTVHGNGFIETYEITCHSAFFDVEAVFVNTTQLMCPIPGRRETKAIDIDIYSIGQPTSIIQETNSISFTYFATPPEVVFFEFDTSYTRLLLEFDREIELGNETDFNTTTQPNCQMIIESLDVFGSPEPLCYWQNTQQRQIIVELNNNSTVKSNSTITLIDGIIRTRYVSYSKLTSGIQLAISNNNHPLNPIAVIDGPQIIPYCGNFTLSGRKSYNTGGRPLQYQWRIEIMDDQMYSGDDEENQISINNLVPDKLSNQQTISLSSELFQVQTVYYLSLTVTNFLGNMGNNELLVIKHDKPALNVMIVGSNLRLVDYTRTFIIEGTTNLPDCLTTDSHTTFKWSVYQNDISIDLNDITTTNSYLQLEGYTLEQNATYLLSFMATRDKITSTANITVRTISTKIRASVFGGTAITYGTDDSILLDATNTVGLIDDLINDNLLRVQWTCLTKPDLAQCVNMTSGLELVLEERIKIIIPPNILSPFVHVITVKLLYSDELISEYQQVIHIVNDTSGSLVFIEEPTDSDKISIHNTLTINGIVESVLPGEAAWSSVYKSGYGYLSLNANNTNTPLTLSIDSQLSQATEDDEQLFTSDITIQSPYANSVSLSIFSGYLLPNNQYCFRLTVTTTNNRTRFAEIEIHTATHPSTGDLSVSPLTGVSLKTVFHITAVGWTDYHNDFPLYYRMGFQATDGIIWLTTKMEEDSLITILPSGDPLIPVLEVSDSYGATTTLTKDIIISHSEDGGLLYVYNHIRDQAYENGNLNEAFAYLISTLYSINSKILTPSSEMTVQDFEDLIIDLIVDLYNEKRFTPNVWLHQVLVQVLSSVTFDATSASSVIPLIEEIVQYGSLVSDTQNGGQDVVTIYSNLIESSSIHDLINARVVTDEVTESFVRMFNTIGNSVCQQIPVFSPSRYIINQDLGSIKLYNSLLQTSLNLTCDNTFNNNCPFSKEDQLTVSMSEQLLESLADFSCQGGSSTINKCSSYCMTSLVLLNDYHWAGSEYASIVKSHPIRLQLVLSDNDMEEITNADLGYPIDFYIPLKFPRSSMGHLKCVHWNEELNDWSDEGCSLLEENSNTVHCRCEHLNEIAVIDICPSGYYGMNCDHICPYGLHGEQCLNECQCSEMGLCSPLNGSCDCSPGWTGDLCDSVCPTGVWGKHCSKPCQCQNEGVCDSVNGGCDCPPGWIGSHCEVGCPEGFYGDNCTETCQCRSNDECDFVSGNCTCEPGYTGATCHAPCESGYYGENCTSLCSCQVNGTKECDNVNGTCYCQDMWSGDDCQIPPYQPIVVVPSSFPVVIVATPVGLGVLAAVIVVAVIVLTCVIVKKHRRTKSVVFPISEQENGKNSIGVESKGDSLLEEVDGEEEDELELTRAKSRTVLIPEGKTLNDLFSKDSSFHDFKEPEQIGTKRRWQIVQILPSLEPSVNIETTLSTPAEPVKTQKINKITEEDKLKVESGIEIESIDGDKELEQREDNKSVTSSSPSDAYQEIAYKKGIYLDTNATLKDLRNGFIDSAQIDSHNRFFQFLNSDMPDDCIPIDNEEDTLLSRLEPNLISPKTMYIETVDNNAVLLELCVCGKFAELECTECRAKGYCSDQCQQDHWLTHSSTCRIVSARRRHTKKMKRKRKKLEKMMKRTGYTPQPDSCVCGGIAQYECSECSRQGYCSEKCQVEDWELHQLFCKQLEEH